MELEDKELIDVQNDSRIAGPDDNKEIKGPCVDRRMLSVKISYGFYFAGLGSWVPYIIIFLISIGLTPFESGLIAALKTVVSTFALPIWGFLSDYTGKRKLILVFLCLGLLCSVFSAPFIARELNNPYQHTNSSNGIMNATSTEISTQYCSTECGNKKMFNGMLGLFLVMGIFAEFGICGLLDSNAMTMIKSNPTKTSYGKQRVYGAVGFAFSSFIAGIAADHFKHQTLVNYTAIFFVLLPFSLLGIPFHVLVAKQAEKYITTSSNNDEEEEPEKELNASGLAKAVFKTCFKPRNFVFLLSVFVQGTTMSFKYSYLFLHMKDNMAASSTAMGLSVVSSNIGEIIIFPFTHFIIKRFGGVRCFIFTIFINSVRYLMLAFITNAWLTLPIEFLHCFGFALCHAAVVETIFEISPLQISSTMFAVQNTLNFTVAAVVGSLVGGYMYGVCGGKMFFIICSAVNAIWAVLAIFLFFVLSRTNKN